MSQFISAPKPARTRKDGRPSTRGQVLFHRQLIRRETLADGGVPFEINSLTKKGNAVKWHPVVNTQDGEVWCDCPDFKYRFARYEPTVGCVHLHCKHVKRACFCLLRNGELSARRNASGHVEAFALSFGSPLNVRNVNPECFDTDCQEQADCVYEAARAQGFGASVYSMPAEVREEGDYAFLVVVECNADEMAHLLGAVLSSDAATFAA